MYFLQTYKTSTKSGNFFILIRAMICTVQLLMCMSFAGSLHELLSFASMEEVSITRMCRPYPPPTHTFIHAHKDAIHATRDVHLQNTHPLITL